jgi:hypothetical protein
MTDNRTPIRTDVNYFWFIGNATREQAERFVETHGAGTFVARYKQQQQQQTTKQERDIVLTWQSNTALRIVHVVVALNDTGWHVVSDARRSYASLHALIRDQPEVLVDERAVATPSDYDDLSRLVGATVAQQQQQQQTHVDGVAASTASTSSSRVYDTLAMNVTTVRHNTTGCDGGDLASLTFASRLPLTRSADDVQLCEQLGEGAFGVVYRGIWQHDVVAVKMLKVAVAPAANKRAKLIADFCAEIRRMAAIPAHENVLLLYGQTTFARQPDVVAAIVEYCEGGSLASLVYNPQCALPLADQLGIAAKAASGVLHLHRNSIVHRDIAARNVLLKSTRAPYGVKVADFGLSRQIDPNASEQRSSSPQPLEWMAPESFGGIYSKFSDSYMFGMLLYEIFERKRPWGDADRGVDGIRALVVGERERPPVRAAPPDVAQLMQQCWHATPHARIGIAEIKRQLESHRLEAMAPAPAPAVAPERATNEFRNQLWGACACGNCDEYYRPVEGAKCDFCGCVVLQHARLETPATPSPATVLAPYIEPKVRQ